MNTFMVNYRPFESEKTDWNMNACEKKSILQIRCVRLHMSLLL